jgi:uncharacterized membrane-anchored protein YjiN (DUF445 family)
MKFEIHADLEQENQEISDKISEFVKNDVKLRIETALEKKMSFLDKTLDKAVSDQVDKHMENAIDKVVRGCMDEYFDEGKFQRMLNKTVSDAFKTLQAKYDIDFATQIIQKMKEK